MNLKKRNTNPPQLTLRFFRWFCDPKLRDSIEGDLIELYGERVNDSGKRKADIRFIIDVLLLFRPGIIRIKENYQHINQYTMYKSYFKVGWRNLVKNAGYSVINIGGLALGMGVAMVIALWVYDELSFNTYHKNYSGIAQVMKGGQFEGRHYAGQTSLPYPLIEELKTNYAQNFKHIVPASWRWDGVLSIGDKRITKQGIYMGESVPEMLSLSMVYGNWSALKEAHAIIISQSTAKALFGDADPLNQVLKINNEKDATITGVYEDIPMGSDFHGLHFFQPWNFLMKDAAWVSTQPWNNHFLQLYVQLAPNVSYEQAGANIINAEMKAIKDLAYMKDDLKYNFEILLHPMRDWHLYSDYEEGIQQNGKSQMLWFIATIGVFVLLLACINFMNLSTARSEKRAKEVGIRKTIGSVRSQLIGQFLSESFMVVVLAFLLAIVFLGTTLPWFNQLAGKDMHLPWTHGWFWISSAAFLFTTALLAGSYPALYLSSFKPISVLKGVFRAGRFATVPRRVLVVVQFTVSVMLIICTAGIFHQLMYVKDRPVGYDREGLIMIRKKSDSFNQRGEALRTELMATGVVSEIAESGGAVTQVWSGNGGFTYKGESIDHDRGYATLGVGHEFGKTVGWQFVSGRDFSREVSSDTEGIIINESAAKFMGLENPVGEVVHWSCEPWNVDQDFVILGVIKDMLMDSPFHPVMPTVYLTIGGKNTLLLRIPPGVVIQDALPKIETVFNRVIPEIPFEYEFADQAYAAKFAAEDRIGKLAAIFATLAVIISCLGLFGLSSFIAEQRTKEIGIRKVLGASVVNLWRMLSREFVLLVIFSCVIAAPLSYYILKKGIEEYDYKTDINGWIFVMAACGALTITLLTVSFQAIKAAVANPVNSLRSE